MSFFDSLLSVGSGLGGVWLGAFLVDKRDERREAARSKKEQTYLAIIVIGHLEKLIHDCADCAYDDGTQYGQPAGENGWHEATTSHPIFALLDIEVDWKSLPSDLMYDIFEIPTRLSNLDRRLRDDQGLDEPPDFVEYFWVRQRGYAEIGIAASEVGARLRKHASLPDLQLHDGVATTVARLLEYKNDLEMREKERQERFANRYTNALRPTSA